MDQPTKTTRQAKPGNEQLNRDKWLDAAFSAAVTGGFSEIKVLAISDALGVTRGSFYWHFKSQQELIDALVERWYQKELETIESLKKAFVDDARTDLMMIFSNAIAFLTPNTPDLQFSVALRAYARSHPDVAQRIAEVDRLRTTVIFERYLLAYPGPAQARQRTVIFYLALGGAATMVTSGVATPEMISLMQRSVVEQLINSIPASQT
jgi:AcrR family transcriptional regulator